MKKLLVVVFLFGAFACDDGDIFDVPVNDVDGDYSYNSSSDYFDQKGELYKNSINRGVLDVQIASTVGRISIIPYLGWTFGIDISNIQTHALANGSTAYTFRIRQQQIDMQSRTFNIFGTGNKELLDSNGSSLGMYDGILYDDGVAEFEYQSIDIGSIEYVITSTTASN